MKHHRLLVLMLSLLPLVHADSALLPSESISRVGDPVVTVTLDRDDWTYGLGEKARFRVAVTVDGQPLRGVEVSYRVGLEMTPAATQKTVTDAGGGFEVDAGTLGEPGFIRCVATYSASGAPVVGRATAGFAPDKIQPTQQDPADFDAFWDTGKAALAKLPIDARLTPLPELGTSKVDVYQLSVQNVGLALSTTRPARVYGMLAVPKASGKYPALLRVPGAGVRAYLPILDLAEKGIITLNLGIHGIPVNLPMSVYESLANGALANYRVSDLDNRELVYFRRVILGCLRAVDYLASRPDWNGRLLVMGGSQGGMLSIATAALDSRVNFLAASMPAYSDVTGYLHGRAGGWPSMFQPDDDGTPNRNSVPEKVATTGYYDTVNFARRVRVPGHYSWGYNDETCPPTTTFSVYNVIKAPKALYITPSERHSSSQAQEAALRAWVVAKVEVEKD